MTLADTAEQRAAADAVRAWARRADPISTVRAQEADPHAWRATWPDVAALGLFGVGVPESAGGAGGTTAELAVLLAEAAAHLVPGPILGTVFAAQLLARSGHDAPLLARLVAGDVPVALGASAVPANDRTGQLVLDGSALVLGAGVDTAVLLPVGNDRWVLLDADTVKPQPTPGADLSQPVATLTLHGLVVAPDRVLHPDPSATNLLVTLLASEAAGVAAWCLDTAVAYAKVREQFGKPIGAFQAVQHLCAGMLGRVQLAEAVTQDAAGCADDAEQFSLAAATAGALALDAAVDNAKDCIQVLGGIGFTWEHDAHLYLRRALSARTLAGGSSRWRRRVAELTAAGTRRTLTIDLGAREEQRAGVRAEAERIAALGPAQQRAALVDAGYLVPYWPAPHGRDADAAEQLIIDDELRRAGVHRPDLVIAGWAIPTILEHGTAEQAERFVGPTLRGEITWCQLFSEPGAGSDLAGLRTRAARVEGGWRLTGQKVWTSEAHRADWGICLARTNPDAPKHRGITYFLVDLHSPGIEVRPLREITGDELFNEVFLDDVFVPDDLVVGAVDGGWPLARTTLANERVAMGGGSSLGDALERVVRIALPTDDPLVLDRLGALIAAGLAGSLLDRRGVLRRLAGAGPGPESSVRKLLGVRHRQDVAEFALELCGPAALAGAPELQEFLLTRCLSIAGGTTQILMSVAAQRILGLPRE